MRQAILDTDTLSYILNRHDADVAARSRQYLRVFGRYSVASVTVSEIIEGFVRSDDQPRLTDFLRLVDDYEILPVDAEEAILAGRILGALARAGQKIGDLDPFIAAVAITNDLPLVTNNARHYARIVALGFPLELENWRRIGA